MRGDRMPLSGRDAGCLFGIALLVLLVSLSSKKAVLLVLLTLRMLLIQLVNLALIIVVSEPLGDCPWVNAGCVGAPLVQFLGQII